MTESESKKKDTGRGLETKVIQKFLGIEDTCIKIVGARDLSVLFLTGERSKKLEDIFVIFEIIFCSPTSPSFTSSSETVDSR